MIHLQFIGSGCWQGIPAPFQDDAISKNVTWNSKDFRFRTSLSLKTDSNKTILVEVTPDIRLQSWKFKINKPEACLISHWHWDHFFGLMDLDWFIEKNGLNIYGSKTTLNWYEKKMSYIKLNFNPFESFQPFTIDNVKITPIPVNHVNDTHGFIFEDVYKNTKIVYLSDLYSLPKKTEEIIKNSNSIIVDATYLESNINDDATHLKKNEFSSFLKKLKTNEIILTNLGSYNNLTHNDLVKKFPQYTISYDGMERNH